MPQNCNLEDVAHIRKFVDIPVVCAGRMTPETAAKAIAAGEIDGMGVARQFLVDGAWVTKLKEGREEDIQPCICCHNGCFPLAHYKGSANDEDFDDVRHMARCALNPMTMQGHKYDIVPAKKVKTIAVIGGGIGGMEAARIAALRGHKVAIYEKTDRLGGVFIAAAAPDFKEKDKELIAWYRRQIEKLHIPVQFHTTVTDLSEIQADEVIVATGAVARRIPIPGAERAMDAVEYLEGRPVGQRVVIIGGGLSGCEIAYDLFHKGKTPIIIEAKNDLMAVRGLCLANSSYLRDFFEAHKVEVHLESGVDRIDSNAVSIREKDGSTVVIPADDVIFAVGYTPAPAFAKGRHVHVIGDACKVGNLRTVVWQAWKVAEKL